MDGSILTKITASVNLQENPHTRHGNIFKNVNIEVLLETL